MKTKFYAKLNTLYILVDSNTGRRSYAVWEDARDHEKNINTTERPMVYDTLADARRAVLTQFIDPCHTTVPDGLAIEKVEFKWFGLRKHRTILPILDPIN